MDTASGNRVDVPLMSARRQRGLSLFMSFMAGFWFVLFAFALLMMQLSPPKPTLGDDLGVALIGLVGVGLFSACSVAIRRASAHLEGTTLYYRGGWLGYRHADLSKVTSAHVSKENRYGGLDLRLSGDGNLKKFPLIDAAAGRLPPVSRERLAAALVLNPNQAAVEPVISLLRS